MLPKSENVRRGQLPIPSAKLEVRLDADGVLEQPFSIHSLQRRAFNRHLLDRMIEHLDQAQTLTKFEPVYEHFCNYGIISQPTS